MFDVSSLARLGRVLECRAVTFENPTGARGAGGLRAAAERPRPTKCCRRASASCSPTSTGPGTIRHIWMTFPPAPPEQMRSLFLEVFYDERDRAEHLGAVRRLLRRAARPTGRLPVGAHVDPGGAGLQLLHPDAVPRARPRRARERRPRRRLLYYQIDYTLRPELPTTSACSTSRFRRENPTTLRQRLRHRRRACAAGAVPRLQRRRPRASTAATGTARAR